jgi:predicted methyltransferase
MRPKIKDESMKKALQATAISAALVFSLNISATEKSATEIKIEQAMQLDYRTDQDKARDKNRSAATALRFMGIKEDMKVFEFGPASGWYTKILAPVLKANGHLTIGYPKSWLAGLDELMKTPQMKKVRRVNLDMKWDEETRAFDFNKIDFQTDNLDMFLNIREYHNLHGEERAEFNQAVFKALKPGGTYVVIDHTRRHMQSDGPENWRREDPVKVLIEIQQAGFDFIKQSDIFYRLDDSLEYEVSRKSVTGNTDRFFFVFKKPE